MKAISDVLKRIIVPLATLFSQDGELNFDEAGHLVNHLISNKLYDSILVAGTTGEFHALTRVERIELFKVVREAAAGQIALLAGTGADSTREALLLTQEAETLGFDAVMVVSPCYCKPIQQGICRHYETIARNTTLPIMLYNIPLFSGVNIDLDTIARLVEIENIGGIKEELGINPTQMTQYALITPEDFTIYNGDDIMILCGLVQGAVGTVSGGAHLVGAKIREMMELFLSGKVEQALQIHGPLIPSSKPYVPKGG